MRGPSSVAATVCSQCAARDPSVVTTVHSSSSTLVFVGAQRQHRLDRQHRARRQMGPAPGRALVGQERVHVHAACRCRGRRSRRRCRTCGRGAPRRRGCRSRWRARRRSAGCRAPWRRYPPPWTARVASRQRLVGGDQRADAERDGRVAVPAVEDRAAVDGHQVTRGQHLVGRRDAVHDAVVDRRADARRESRGSRGTTGCRRRRGSPTRRSSSSSSVETPGCGGLPDGPQRRGDQGARGGHRVELAGGALRNDLAAAQPGQRRSSVYLPSARSARANTSSRAPTASTVLSSSW